LICNFTKILKNMINYKQPQIQQVPSRRSFAFQFATISGLLVSGSAFAQTAAYSGKLTKTPNTPPEELNAFGGGLPNWRQSGKGALRFFGFKAYDAYLWVGGAVPANQNPSQSPLIAKSLFALEIVYSASLNAQEIVNVSMLEMSRLKQLSDGQRKMWTDEMNKTFPSVKAGDRLTGVYLPKVGTRFFFNGKLISEINDVAFGEAFFAIWLDERAKKPELRRELLGLPPGAAPSSAADKAG
jgi:Chalcone isomerase-like